MRPDVDMLHLEHEGPEDQNQPGNPDHSDYPGNADPGDEQPEAKS